MANQFPSNVTPIADSATVFSLPPLILHPFADSAAPNRLVASSRASLALQGLLPSGENSREDLDRVLLDGRYSEMRMLYYVGKDLVRWIDQCLEFADRNHHLMPPGIKYQSFAALLVNDAPAEVQEKLRKWGVADYKAIFARALGLNSLFADVPTRDMLSEDFVRHYFRYADQLFSCRQNQSPFTSIHSREFQFELYSSGEYSRKLERAWES